MIGELDYGLIHADAVRDNVLFQDNYKVNLIDFDDSGFGFRLFDIATTLLHYIKDKNFLKIKKNILKGYLSIRFLDMNFLNHKVSYSEGPLGKKSSDLLKNFFFDKRERSKY